MEELEGKAFGLPLTDGARVLVLLGGFPDDHAHWQHQIGAFEGDYHILSIATPDFDRLRLRRKWGYEPAEVVTLIRACIDKHLCSGGDSGGGGGGGGSRPDRSFDLCAHDWGAYWGYLLVAQLNAPKDPTTLSVRKLVTLDVGAGARSTPRAVPAADLAAAAVAAAGKSSGSGGGGKKAVRAQHPGQKGFLWTLPYQLTFATIFLVGTLLSEALADLLLRFFMHVLWPLLGPLGRDALIVRPLEEVQWWMCWPYYQLWFNHIFRLRAPPLPQFPSCPTLFIWGERKRAFFHTGKFVAKLQSTQGCDAKSYDASHWVHWEKAEQVNSDMRSFLLSD